MYGRSVAVGRIINAVHRLNEKLITIWKSEGSHGLVYHRYLGTPRVPADIRTLSLTQTHVRNVSCNPGCTCYERREDDAHVRRAKLRFPSL